MSSKKVWALLAAGLAGSVLVWVAATVTYAQRRTEAVKRSAEAWPDSGLTAQSLPDEWKRILLRVEDPAFYEHNGIDVTTPGAGLTTLTQALVKREYFKAFRPGPVAKLKQSIYALVLDAKVSKDLQLTHFLNTASFGPSDDGWVQGFPSAARAFFGKEFHELTNREFTTLAALLVAPARYRPVPTSEELEERVRRIERMLREECHPLGNRDVFLEGCSG